MAWIDVAQEVEGTLRRWDSYKEAVLQVDGQCARGALLLVSEGWPPAAIS